MNEKCKDVLDRGVKRVSVYDWLRLIATLFVVIGHSAYLNIQTTYGGVAYELPVHVSAAYYSSILNFFRTMAGWVYGFHMPLFFFLSGAVLNLRPLKKFDDICVDKIKRLLVPYFTVGIFFMLPVKYLSGFYTKENLLLAVNGFWQGADSGHLWFLIALFWCMIVFVSIIKVLGKLGCSSNYVLLLIAGIIQLIYAKLPFDVLGLKQGLSYIFWFAAGYLFETIRKTEEGKWSVVEKIVVLIGCILGVYLNFKYKILNSFFTIILGCFFTYMMASVCDELCKTLKTNNYTHIYIYIA